LLWLYKAPIMIRNLLQSIAHPSEVRAMLYMKWNGELSTSNEHASWEGQSDPKAFCYFALNRVSRSFAAVIRQLPAELEDAICAFYLVLRGLDSVEDDMHIPLDEKQKLLTNFYLHLGKGKNYVGIGDTNDYRALMARFENVDAFFSQLPEHHQKIIRAICKKMGKGMVEFTEKEVSSISDHDHYCHIVAGLVGLGLTQLFAASEFEDKTLLDHLAAANSMGLFLQKTNITRDYHEDLLEGRLFWPSEIWQKYASDISEFNKRPNNPKSLCALNDMVVDALRHLPDCIRYLAQLKHPAVFRFCAIPQAMAIATLVKVYNNSEVFKHNVKIRKGLAAKIMVKVTDADSLWNFMLNHLQLLENKTLNAKALAYVQETRIAIHWEKSNRTNREAGYRQVS